MKKHAARERGRRAFTLIELLVVIAVLAILAGLVITAARRGADTGQAARCMANMRQVSAALMAYAGDHRGFVPKAFAADTPLWWGEVLADEGYIPPIPTNSRRPDSILFCPASKTYRTTGIWYWANGNYGINRHLAGNDSSGLDFFEPVPMQAISQPSKLIMMLDAGVMGMTWNVGASPAPWVFYVPGSEHNKTVDWPEQAAEDALHGRHSGKVHVSYVDGHIETHSAAEIEDYRLWINQ